MVRNKDKTVTKQIEVFAHLTMMNESKLTEMKVTTAWVRITRKDIVKLGDVIQWKSNLMQYFELSMKTSRVQL